MQIYKYNPYNNSVRFRIKLKKSLLSKTNNFFKKTIFGFKRHVGRCSQSGNISVRHLGAGCKKKYREVNFFNYSFNSVILCIMYDPFRKAFLSLNFDLETNKFFRNIAVIGTGPGSLQLCKSIKMFLKLGIRTQIDLIPAGTYINNISLNNKSKIARSAGSSVQFIQKVENKCKVRFPSGQIKLIKLNSFGTIGITSNKQSKLIVLSKAGANRLRGVRPSVRGVAMNPVDHPHGGRTKGGRPDVTPWGLPTKGKPTVKKIKNYE